MRNTIEAARLCGMLNDAGRLLDQEEFGYLPPDKVMLLCTGSQGEPRAAIARIAEDQHPHISLEPGDLVIFSSKTIPGNEKEVSRVLNNLAELDIDMVTGDDDLVHSSGHPRQGELALLYDWVKPKALIPMHGAPSPGLPPARWRTSTRRPAEGCMSMASSSCRQRMAPRSSAASSPMSASSSSRW
jgi:ribonuclease J